MKLRFWGTRGSVSPSFSAKKSREKARQLLRAAQGRFFADDAQLEHFLDHEVPFHQYCTYGTNTLCVELEGSSYEYLLCDLGTGAVDFIHHWKGSAASLQGNVFHVVLSHLHWDHVQGLLFFLLAIPTGNRVIIHTYHDKAEATLQLMMAPPLFPVALDHVAPEVHFNLLRPYSSFQAAGYRIESILQNHPGLSYGYSFQKQGKKLVYSTDCEHPRGEKTLQHPFVRFYHEADVLIFDAMSSFAEAEQLGWGHSTYKTAVELATWARAKRLVFIHHDPQASDAQLASLGPLAQDYYQVYQETLRASGTESSPDLRVDVAYDGWELQL